MTKPLEGRLENPFRPGAGHIPPYLAGREQQAAEFKKILEQEVILENLIISGLRGTGKTVFLESLKPEAFRKKWLWVGTDLSESASISEKTIVTRLLADLSVATAGISIEAGAKKDSIGFLPTVAKNGVELTYPTLEALYFAYPGLPADKLKALLELTWRAISSNQEDIKGIIFAYDEAQNISDHSERDEFPLSLLLDVFQSLQRKNIPILLILTGLPTLFSRLIEARTYSERMFRTIELSHLSKQESHDAVQRPLEDGNTVSVFTEIGIQKIIEASGGYPYFIQFIAREAFDFFVSRSEEGERVRRIPFEEIITKLDTDFFAGRWNNATDRQRELLRVAAEVEDQNKEFSIQDIAEASRKLLTRPISPSQVNQMLVRLPDMVHKTRHGKYSFAVPLLGRYIKRQEDAGLFS